MLKEIGSALDGTYVNNIFSFGPTQLFRFRRRDAADVWLVASPRKGVWISEKVNEREETTEFTSKLRGVLERAKFTGAAQAGLDRVFELSFEGGEGRKLVVELMPPGNIVLTDEEGKVILAQAEVRSRTRRVVRGGVYQPPRQSRLSPLKLRPEDVEAMLAQEDTAGKAVGRHVALPRKYVAETLTRLGVSEDAPAASLVGREGRVAEAIAEIITDARDHPSPCVCETADGEEIFVIRPTGLKVKEESSTVSALCDLLFLKELKAGPDARTPEEARMAEMEATSSKLKSESAALLAAASKARSAALAAAAGSMEEAQKILKEAGTSLAKVPASPAALASALYDHAKKLERRSAESLEAAERLRKKLAKIVPAESQGPRRLPRRKQEWYEKFRWFYTSEGKLAVGGRDAQSNTLLVKRHLDDADVVYHADLFGSPFFVLKDGLRQSEAESLELAQATVSFSSGWKTGLGAADAYWVLKDQVSGAAESGEYLAKGSFVIRGQKNVLRHAMLQVAVGIDGGGRVVAGPESAVAKASARYVVLIPHREKSSDTAKKVLRELASSAGEGVAPLLDDVIRALPSGGGKIVRRRSTTVPSG